MFALCTSCNTGESKVILAARQLMHSCQMYEDCLTTLESSLRDRASVARSSGSSDELDRSITNICTQVQLDTELLRTIEKETKAIAKSTATKGYLHNVAITAFTGRVEKIRNLEAELMMRVQLVTSIMTKDVWKVCMYVF